MIASTLLDCNGNRIPMIVVSKTGCWIWTRNCVSGYGRWPFRDEFFGSTAHRAVYQIFNGPVDPEWHVDHLCRVTLCVNPAHLEAVTERENILRGVSQSAINARKTACKNGHPFTPENTGRDRNGRRCRACDRRKAAARIRRRIPGMGLYKPFKKYRS